VVLIHSEILDKFSQIPCHTQSVEKCIKLVTEASVAICETERRFVKNRLEARRIMPNFSTKKNNLIWINSVIKYEHIANYIIFLSKGYYV
jgi:hypothetical protein